MVPGPNSCKGITFWPQDGSLPDISLFASEESFLLFNVMDIDNDWLQEMLETPAKNWSADPDSSVHSPRSIRSNPEGGAAEALPPPMQLARPEPH